MQIIFLGTNGWFDSETGSTICTLIKCKECNIILDAGYGIYKADTYIDQKKPTYIFLSHLHIDHIVGLHVLEKFRFAEELKIYTPVNTEVELKNFLRQPFTMPLSSLPFKAEIYPALEKFFLPGIKVKTLELMHSTKCIGYRIQVENKSIVYCTDTGVCDNIIKLAKQADLLITECALKQDEGLEGWPHLNPIDAANLAKESQVRKLVLTHFDAHNYQNKNERNVAQARAEKIFPAVLSAFDRLELDI